MLTRLCGRTRHRQDAKLWKAWLFPNRESNAREKIIGRLAEPEPNAPVELEILGHQVGQARVQIVVGPGVEPQGEIKIKEFPGGLYAVTRCEVKNPWDDIPGTWKRLAAWLENSKYRWSPHQYLEEHLGPLEFSEEFVLDLYMPIAE